MQNWYLLLIRVIKMECNSKDRTELLYMQVLKIHFTFPSECVFICVWLVLMVVQRIRTVLVCVCAEQWQMCLRLIRVSGWGRGGARIRQQNPVDPELEREEKPSASCEPSSKHTTRSHATHQHHFKETHFSNSPILENTAQWNSSILLLWERQNVTEVQNCKNALMPS